MSASSGFPLAGARLDEATGVWLLGEPLPYSDGSEDAVLRTLSGAADRSSTSDELAAGIVDWPTRYHLSRMRGNLLRPFRIGTGTRVLDVGAGTGALARHLGERGAEVLALEGAYERARAAALRCSDLDSVTVALGGPGDLVEGGFDVVLIVGVLEYSSAAIGGGGGPEQMLTRARELLAPGGVVVLAVENQLGLKYLLGYPEDHTGEAWVGIEGYPGGLDVRTWSRRDLTELLAGTGLPAQRWLFPFPDYKLPSVTLAEDAYARADAAGFVDQVVRGPVVDWAHPRPALLDDRRAHRQFVAAGLGPDVANSFLVVAGRDDSAVAPVVPEDVTAWLFGGERMSRFLRPRNIRQRGGDLVVEPEGERAGEAAAGGWLVQRAPDVRPYVRGDTLEQLALDASATHDDDALTGALRRWDSALGAEEQFTGGTAHPFAGDATESVLPADHVDVELANFVDDGGSVERIDREWEVAGGVDAAVARARALWYLARQIVSSQARHPFGADATVDAVTHELSRRASVRISEDVLARWKDAEAELQHVVTGLDRDLLRARYTQDGLVTTATAAPPRGSGQEDVRDHQRAEIERLAAENERLRRPAAGRVSARFRRLFGR